MLTKHKNNRKDCYLVINKIKIQKENKNIYKKIMIFLVIRKSITTGLHNKNKNSIKNQKIKIDNIK